MPTWPRPSKKTRSPGASSPVRSDAGARGPEGAREVRQTGMSGARVGPGHEARAVEAARVGTAGDVRSAQLAERDADRTRGGRGRCGQGCGGPAGAGAHAADVVDHDGRCVHAQRLRLRRRASRGRHLGETALVDQAPHLGAQPEVALPLSGDGAADARLQRLQLGGDRPPLLALPCEASLAPHDLHAIGRGSRSACRRCRCSCGRAAQTARAPGRSCAPPARLPADRASGSCRR